MVGLFCGEMGRSILEYNELTLKEYHLIVSAYRKKETEQYQQAWERTRWIGYISLLPHQKKGRRMKPADILKFPWEEMGSQQEKRQSRAEVKAMLDRINKRDNTAYKIKMTDG